MKKITLPQNDTRIEVESQHCFVIVGANGSGKSRLGAWIEQQHNDKTHRISAQRALSIPDSIIIKSKESAWNKIFYGEETQKDKGHKWNWGRNLTTKLIDDYSSVLSFIFAIDSNEKNAFFDSCRKNEEDGTPKPNTPITIVDKIIDIWKNVFPHREILLKDAKVSAVHNGSSYHGKEMSDGERVAIYLIGQCLVAPADITLIIDEPEIHLHKSIMNKLWDKIEEYCPDKTIIYITHDLDFASSRKDSTKIWVKEFNNNQWDLAVLKDNEKIPDSLMIEVLGNRKNVLFVEGEKGSYDSQLYSYIYHEYYIIPRKNCRTVIESTKAFNDIKEVHNLEIKGIIDRDYMTTEEIQSYSSQDIHTLDVAEIENLYCVEGVLRIVAEHLALENINKLIQDIKEFLFDSFIKEFDLQLASMCEKEIKHKLNCYNKTGNNKDILSQDLTDLVSSINVESIYNTQKTKLDKIVQDRNYNELLKVYNRKSLHKRISSYFRLSNGEYAELVLRLLKTNKKDEIVTELRKFTPEI